MCQNTTASAPTAETALEIQLDPPSPSRPEQSAAVMFSGSSDARNVFATILSLFAFEQRSGTGIKFRKDLHVTMIDLKPAAMARFLVVCNMMMEYTVTRARAITVGDRNARAMIETVPTMLAYIFVGQVIPASVNRSLQSHIEGILDVIETDVPLLDNLFMPKSTRSQVARVLRQWQQWTPAGCYTTRAVRQNVAMTLTAMRETRPGFDGTTGTGTLPSVEFSYEIFSRDTKRSGQLGVMMPPESYSQLQGPEILEISQQIRLDSYGQHPVGFSVSGSRSNLRIDVDPPLTHIYTAIMLAFSLPFYTAAPSSATMSRPTSDSPAASTRCCPKPTRTTKPNISCFQTWIAFATTFP